MSEKRDLQDDLEFVVNCNSESEWIEKSIESWPHALDRAIAAEKERDELRKALEYIADPENSWENLPEYARKALGKEKTHEPS